MEEEKKKANVSADWTEAERRELISLIQADLQTLEEQDKEWRKNILYEAPCLKENKAKRNNLTLLIEFATVAPTEFLQLNRKNYNDYLEE